MAGYLSPAAYLYVEEQEYLQAYEDVLERYKALKLRIILPGVSDTSDSPMRLPSDAAAPAWSAMLVHVIEN